VLSFLQPARREVVAPLPTPQEPAPLHRLRTELRFYDRSATNKRRCYQGIRALELLIGASIPAGASLGLGTAWLGALGVAIVVLQGLQELGHFYPQWRTHRDTFESLKREEALYLARAGFYRECADPDTRLAERIEDIRGAETSQFVETLNAPPPNVTSTQPSALPSATSGVAWSWPPADSTSTERVFTDPERSRREARASG